MSSHPPKGFVLSLQSSAILPAHVSPGDLCTALREIDGIIGVGARQMTRPEYQLIEFELDGRRLAIHAFLRSYAADDYADVVTGDSTLLTIEASPNGAGLLARLVGPGGWIKSSDEEPWRLIG